MQEIRIQIAIKEDREVFALILLKNGWTVSMEKGKIDNKACTFVVARKE